jgi:hypothetical protein
MYVGNECEDETETLETSGNRTALQQPTPGILKTALPHGGENAWSFDLQKTSTPVSL